MEFVITFFIISAIFVFADEVYSQIIERKSKEKLKKIYNELEERKARRQGIKF